MIFDNRDYENVTKTLTISDLECYYISRDKPAPPVVMKQNNKPWYQDHNQKRSKQARRKL